MIKVSFRLRVAILLFLAFSMVAGAFLFLDPISQDPAYHCFADTRSFLWVPNFGDVMSNLPFIVVGAAGLFLVGKKDKSSSNYFYLPERWIWATFFLSVMLVGFGSGYYHWNPDNETLVWDRLPITVALTSILAFLITERVQEKVSLVLFPILILGGAGSVLYWSYTEALGRGDLRPYALVHFFPVVAFPFFLLFFPARYTRSGYLWGVLAWYGLSRVCEYYDRALFEKLHATVSGHTLKHLTAAAGVYWVLKYFRSRRRLGASPD